MARAGAGGAEGVFVFDVTGLLPLLIIISTRLLTGLRLIEGEIYVVVK